MTLSVKLKNPKRIANLPRFPYNRNSYDQSNLFDLCKPIRLMIKNDWMMLIGRELLQTPGK